MPPRKQRASKERIIVIDNKRGEVGRGRGGERFFSGDRTYYCSEEKQDGVIDTYIQVYIT